MAAAGPTISYVRGDTIAFPITLTKSDAAFDVTGLVNIEIVVNSDLDPVDTTDEQFRMPGTIVVPATDGIIDFQPAGANVAARKVASEAYVPDRYFYDLQADDAAGERVTLLKGGVFIVQQDINKS